MNESKRNDTPDPGLEQLIDTWRDWGLPLTGRPRLIERIQTGRTNRNYRLSAPGLSNDLLIRVNHPASERLGIDRERERRVLSLTSDAGIARPFWYWDAGQRFVVFPYLSARTWTQKDLQDPAQRDRLWPMLEALHTIEPDGPRRSYHAYLRHYWQQLEGASLVDPATRQAWEAFEPRLKAFDASSWTTRLVHHDLIPDNILETEKGLYLIDWEYAAPGHPDIDVWTIDPAAVGEPFVAEMMQWINDLWERLILISDPEQ